MDEFPSPIDEIADPPPLPNASSTLSRNDRDTDTLQVAAVVEQVFSTMTMEMKSILTPDQIYHVARLLIFAEKHQSGMAAKIAMVLMELKVSEKGYGRRDMREVLMALLQRESTQAVDQKNLFQRLIGRG